MTKVKVLRSLPARLRGLIARPLGSGAVLLVGCDDVHTFGMDYDIDIAFLDRAGRVLASYRQVAPRCRLRCPGAEAVLECASHPEKRWFEPGSVVGSKICHALERRQP